MRCLRGSLRFDVWLAFLLSHFLFLLYCPGLICYFPSAVFSGAGEETPSVPADFPALGVEWPEGPQFLVAPRGGALEAGLIENLQLLLQMTPLPSVEAMREHLATCTKGYHAFGFSRATWMSRLEHLWAEFACRHVAETRRRQLQSLIQQEEEAVSQLRTRREHISAQATATQEQLQVASSYADELVRELETLQQRAREAQNARDLLRAKVIDFQRELSGVEEVLTQ